MRIGKDEVGSGDMGGANPPLSVDMMDIQVTLFAWFFLPLIKKGLPLCYSGRGQGLEKEHCGTRSQRIILDGKKKLGKSRIGERNKDVIPDKNSCNNEQLFL